jgi:peptidoglycan/LPS O-acetylase OafA/YrhL
MTSQTAQRAGFTAWLAVNARAVIKVACLVFVALASFALAFTHMHDWTAEALPGSAEWMRWANAVVSEILPTMSFIIWQEREEQERPSRAPLLLFLGSVVLSILAQLSATGLRIPYDAQLLACLPAIALMLLAKMVLGDLSYTRKAKLTAIAEAARKTELARNIGDATRN